MGSCELYIFMYLTLVARRNRFMGFADRKLQKIQCRETLKIHLSRLGAVQNWYKSRQCIAIAILSSIALCPLMIAIALVNMARRFARQLFVSLDLVLIRRCTACYELRGSMSTLSPNEVRRKIHSEYSHSSGDGWALSSIAVRLRVRGCGG